MHIFKTYNAIVFILNVILISACNKVTEETIAVENLKCDMLINPEGIDTEQPLLSWNIVSEQRNIKQTAYHILVASSPEILEKNEADLWNSGKVTSENSVHVLYGGKELVSGIRCFWKVRVWSEHGESEWSEPARWSMGLLNYKDWKGRWIGFDKAFPWDRIEKFSRLSARYFRKEFETAKGKSVKNATAYILGLGLYNLYINGEKTGDHVLSPAPTDYLKSAMYNAYDVTEQIRQGQNAIGAVLGNGRYFTMRQNYKPYKIKTFGYPKILLNLVIEYSDGSKDIIKTDNSWKGTADGPIRSNNEYDGEEYDARKEMPGWNSIGYDDDKWLMAEYVQEPGGDYKAQMNENMKVMKLIKPVSVTESQYGRYILDMGQNMTGWLRMRVKGISGDQVVMRFAESLKENGDLFVANLRDALVTDKYTLKGGGQEIWEPSFVYHGFRYVEITGYPGIPALEDFEGCVVYDDMLTIGSFKTSDSLINQIYNNAYWSISGTYKGMPIDCPQRNERMPWLGDRAVGCYGESFVMDNCRLYVKWLEDIRESQKSDGSLPDVAPPYFRYYSDNMTWPGTYLFVAEMLYNQFGLVQPIINNYPYMKKWIDYMQNRYMEGYILTEDSYGDWCAPPKTIEEGRNKSANVKHPSELISMAYFYRCLLMMQNFARLSGMNEDIAEYRSLAENVRKAFHDKFYNKKGNYYGSKKLTENILPLYFNMIPAEYEEAVLETIRDIIMIENNGHLSSGLVGVQWLMRSLSEHGMQDIAYKLATNTTFPSWGYMVKNGATSIWELWNANTAAPNMNSQNHVMLLGDLVIWYFEDLAGIKSDKDNPGFKKIIMDPVFPDQLEMVNASYQSAYGKIQSHWIKKTDKIRWKITVPPNTSADVYFPVNDLDLIAEDENSIEKSHGINKTLILNNKVLLEIGSGSYNFTIKLNADEY